MFSFKFESTVAVIFVLVVSCCEVFFATGATAGNGAEHDSSMPSENSEVAYVSLVTIPIFSHFEPLAAASATLGAR